MPCEKCVVNEDFEVPIKTLDGSHYAKLFCGISWRRSIDNLPCNSLKSNEIVMGFFSLIQSLRSHYIVAVLVCISIWQTRKAGWKCQKTETEKNIWLTCYPREREMMMMTSKHLKNWGKNIVLPVGFYIQSKIEHKSNCSIILKRAGNVFSRYGDTNNSWNK